jgi:hypothetical protein
VRTPGGRWDFLLGVLYGWLLTMAVIAFNLWLFR